MNKKILSFIILVVVAAALAYFTSAKREEVGQADLRVREAVRLVLEPKPTEPGQKKEKFSGLFGMNGAISIWIDVKTHRPILVTGKLPVGFMNLFARIELEKAERIKAPAEGSD